MSRDTDNNDEIRRQLERQRRDADSEATLVAYRDDATRKRGFTGDEDASFVKTPPFPSKAELFFERQLGAPGVVFDSIDIQVGLFSQMLLWVEYRPPAPNGVPLGQLLLVPETLNVNTEEFFPMVVIDPTLAIGVPAPGFAARTMFQTALNCPAVGTRWIGRFQLDVSGDEVVRFRVGEALNANGGFARLSWSGAT